VCLGQHTIPPLNWGVSASPVPESVREKKLSEMTPEFSSNDQQVEKRGTNYINRQRPVVVRGTLGNSPSDATHFQSMINIDYQYYFNQNKSIVYYYKLLFRRTSSL